MFRPFWVPDFPDFPYKKKQHLGNSQPASIGRYKWLDPRDPGPNRSSSDVQWLDPQGLYKLPKQIDAAKNLITAQVKLQNYCNLESSLDDAWEHGFLSKISFSLLASTSEAFSVWTPNLPQQQ